MTDTEANLMISDEENGNLYSGRSFQDKLSATKSPKDNQKFLSTQDLLASAEGKRDNNYFNSPGSQNQFNPPEKSESHPHHTNQNHTSNQGVKQSISRDSEEEPTGHTSDISGKKNLKKLISDNKSSDKSNPSRSEQATIRSQNHTAPDHNNPEPRHSHKEQHSGEEAVDEHGNPRSRKVKSAHNSHNGQSVRYSKMSEEDAANIFENRKKELLNNLMKKNAQKKGGEEKENMAETPQPHPRPVLDSPTNKDNKNGFVVFKSNNPQNKPLPQKSESAKESERKYSKPNLQRPHSSARGSEANTANPKRGKPTIEVATSNKKAVPQTNNFHTPKANTNFRTEKVFETAGKSSAAKSTAKEENRINVNLKKPSKGYASNHRDSSTSKNESSNKTSQREYDQQQQQQLYQQYEEEYRQNQMYLQKFAHQQLQEQAQYQNPYQIPYQNSGKIEKNQEILYEIQNIDQEIQMLESENVSPPSAQAYPSNKRSESSKKQTPSNQNSSQKQSGRDKFTKEGKFFIDENVMNERGKIQKINELMESKKHLRNNSGGHHIEHLESEPQQSPNDESLNIPLVLNKSYNVLNQKTFNKRYDYLYERALVQKNARELLAERSKQIREKKELRKCTFSPDINDMPNAPYEDIISKTRKWQIQKEKVMIDNEREKVRQELEGCTFYPNGMLEREDNLIFDANSFYKKNIEWQKRVEAAAMRKKEELYTSIMTGPEKSRIQNSTLSFSKLNTSNSQMMNTSNSQPKRDGTPKSTKQVATSKVNTPVGSNKKTFRSPSQKELSAKRTDSKSNLKLEINTSKRNDSFYSDRKTTAPKSTTNDEFNQKQLQSQILESYALLDNLKGYVSSRRETIERKDSEAKENLDKKLKTTRTKTESSAERKETPTRKSSHTSIMATIRREISSKGLPSPKHTYLKGESPLNGRGTPGKNSSRDVVATSVDDRSGTVSSGRLVVKKNRYYVEENSERGDRGSRASSQSRDQSLRSPSIDVKPNPAQASRRTPEKKPPKSSNPTAYTSPSQIYYPHPFESQFVSPRADPSFQSPRSPIYISNTNTNGLTSPSGNNLENKYLELLSQVSKVTSQIEKIKSSNSSLQNDIYSMKSGNGKRSMYS